jgi:hypothetical protein
MTSPVALLTMRLIASDALFNSLAVSRRESIEERCLVHIDGTQIFVSKERYLWFFSKVQLANIGRIQLA